VKSDYRTPRTGHTRKLRILPPHCRKMKAISASHKGHKSGRVRRPLLAGRLVIPQSLYWTPPITATCLLVFIICFLHPRYPLKFFGKPPCTADLNSSPSAAVQRGRQMSSVSSGRNHHSESIFYTELGTLRSSPETTHTDSLNHNATIANPESAHPTPAQSKADTIPATVRYSASLIHRHIAPAIAAPFMKADGLVHRGDGYRERNC
jgi:hypothetical protein